MIGPILGTKNQEWKGSNTQKKQGKANMNNGNNQPNLTPEA